MSKCNCDCHKEEREFQVGDVIDKLFSPTLAYHQPKNPATCPTCNQKLPIKQEYCCEPFRNAVLSGHFTPSIHASKWQHDNVYYDYCNFCGKTPKPPIKEGK